MEKKLNLEAGGRTAQTSGPSPTNFPEYLLYACKQLQLSTLVQVTRLTQSEYISAISPASTRAKSTKAKAKTATSPIDSEDNINDDDAVEKSCINDIEDYVKILAYYDCIDHLVHIKFDNNRTIIQPIWVVVGLILELQPYLQMISVNRGLDKYGVYELSKILVRTNITDLCFDGCYLPEGNYDILLGGKNALRQLSLCRCSINDEVVNNLASRLIYPLPASYTLSILNLSSNKITDEGATFLGQMLRSNRTLTYLNLAGNLLTDEGAGDILSSLLEFPVTCDELKITKEQNFKYIKEKKIVMRELLQDMMKQPSTDNKNLKKKTVKSNPLITTKKSKTFDGERSSNNPMEPTKSYVDPNMYEKAKIEAEDYLGPYLNPFLPSDNVIKEGYVFCCGNNTLSYLNLAYNNLSFITLKKLLDVLLYQRFLDRTPRGLVTFSVEGNNLPVTCDEYAQIEYIIEQGLMSNSKKTSQITKKGRTTISAKTPH